MECGFAVRRSVGNGRMKSSTHLRLVLRRRKEPALDTMNAEEVVRLLTIHFDGSIEPRNPVQIEAIKGKLFRVHPGDLVFSKIDVRNGASRLGSRRH